MRLSEIVQRYITPVKRFDADVSAEQMYAYYQQSAEVQEIEAFMNIRFHRKFKEYIQTQDQSDYLNDKAKEISRLAQKMFELKFPQYYQ